MAYLKTHDIVEKLRGRADPIVIDILCKIVEGQQEHRQTFRTVAEIIDNLTNQFAVVVSAATKLTPENLRATLMGQTAKDKINSMQESDDDIGSTGGGRLDGD